MAGFLNKKRRRPGGPTEDYSAIRSGIVDFVESGIGLGDELDAFTRRLTGESATFDEGLDASRRDLDYFERENPFTSKAITVAGIGASLFIPGGAAAKLGQGMSTAGRVGVMAGFGAAEGAAYGYAAGRDDGRTQGALMGIAAGGALGGLTGKFLTKSAKETQKALKPKTTKKSRDTHIGGEEGFARNVPLAKDPATGRFSGSGTTQKRNVKEVKEQSKPKKFLDTKGSSNLFDDAGLTMREWYVKFVGQRSARLAEDAEHMQRRAAFEVDDYFDTTFTDVGKKIEGAKDVKTALLNMNEEIRDTARTNWSDVFAVASKRGLTDDVQKLKDESDRILADDIPAFRSSFKGDYFPALAFDKADGRAVSADIYDSPVNALRSLAKEISDARNLANRFEVDWDKLPAPKEGMSRVEVVIRAIKKKALKEGAPKNVAKNLENGLRSQFVAANKGGNALGAVLRRATSTALLANPMNAVLNISEGITAPLYQNGFRAWAETVPGAIAATFGRRGAKWLNEQQLGSAATYTGDLVNVAEKTYKEAADVAKWTQLPRGIVRGTDKVGETLYKASGVEAVNRMGKEILGNTAVKRGIRLAKKGDEASLAKLRKHDGMRGLTQREFDDTVAALRSEDVTNGWVVNFAGAAMGKWQPVNAISLPKALHDNPNGRVMYSMLSYMNTQMNNIRTDVGLNLLNAQRYGLNSKEGAQAARDAMRNSVKYIALFGVFAGMWDDARKTLDLSSDRELSDLMNVDNVTKAALNQITSNVSSGLVNMRAAEFGGKPFQPIPAPASAAFNIGSGLYDAAASTAAGQPDFTSLGKAAQTYIPGISAADRLSRMGLFDVPDAISEVRLPNRGGRLFEELGLME